MVSTASTFNVSLQFPRQSVDALHRLLRVHAMPIRDSLTQQLAPVERSHCVGNQSKIKTQSAMSRTRYILEALEPILHTYRPVWERKQTPLSPVRGFSSARVFLRRCRDSASSTNDAPHYRPAFRLISAQPLYLTVLVAVCDVAAATRRIDSLVRLYTWR